MAQEVDVKGFGLAEFPDGIDRETMLTALRRRFANAGKRAVGATEALGSIASSMVAEPVSGIAGIAGALLPGEQGQGARWVDKTQQALTYEPRTATGKARLQDAGEALAPIGEVIIGASEKLGDKAFEATNSPLLATAAYSAPTAMLEALGVKGLRAPSKSDLYSPNIFAGVNAKTADLSSLKIAQDMEKAGADRLAIWNETGWLNDSGDWKFEISDDTARLAPGDLPTLKIEGEELPEMGFANMSDVLQHQKLFDAYPQLGELGFATNPKMQYNISGSFTDEGIQLNKPRAQDYVRAQEDWVARQQDPNSPDYWERQAEEAYSRGEYETLDEAKGDLKRWLDRDVEDLNDMKSKYWTDEDLSTTIHEMQHAVQSIEGFNRGGNPNMARYAMEKGMQTELQPVSTSKYLFDYASDKYKATWARAYIADLERIVQKESPKPSEVTNLSDWYQYSDDIRDKFGVQPKSPGVNRDNWVRSAAAFLRNKAIEDGGMYGSSKSEIAKRLLDEQAEIKKDLRSARLDMDKHAKGTQKYREIERKYEALKQLSNAELYKRLGGEVESRLTEARLNLTPEERRAKAPWSQLDVPENEIIPSKR